jgi:hypothetical protein
MSHLLQPQAALSDGRRSPGGRLVWQPSSMGIAVVEHKAQRHFEGLLSLSLFFPVVCNAARDGHRNSLVPHVV